MTRKFSIVVPTFNRPELLKRSLAHILKQSYENYEVIVVNDGGGDEAERVVEGFASDKLRYVWKENEQKGIAKNHGFSLAEGDYISSFDDDDIMYSNHLAAAERLITANGSPAVGYVHYEICGLDGVFRKAGPPVPVDIHRQLRKKNILSNNGMFLRRDLFPRYRYLEDARLTLSSDWLLWLKLSAEQEFVCSDEVTHGVCEHETRGSASANPAQYERNRQIFMTELSRFYADNGHGAPGFLRSIDGHYRTYVALFLALGDSKREALRSFLQGVRLKPSELLSKRAAVIGLKLAGLK